MWMFDQFRGAASVYWPLSILSLGVLGCVQAPPFRRVITEPAPHELESQPGESQVAGAQAAEADLESWNDPRDDSQPADASGPLGTAEAAREAALAAAGGAAPTQRRSLSPSDNALIDLAHAVLDDWHQAAASGERDRYVGHFSPDAVFMGPDAAERWDLATFTAHVNEYFRPGAGWAYQPSNRHVMLGAGSKFAWFDEELDSAGYDALRGTGVLRLDDGTWKIAHYSMVYTIPSDAAREVVDVVKEARSRFPASRR